MDQINGQRVLMLLPVNEEDLRPTHPKWRGWFALNLCLGTVDRIMRLAGLVATAPEIDEFSFTTVVGGFAPEYAPSPGYALSPPRILVANDAHGDNALRVRSYFPDRSFIETAPIELADLYSRVRLTAESLVAESLNFRDYPAPVFVDYWTDEARARAIAQHPSIEKFWLVRNAEKAEMLAQAE